MLNHLPSSLFLLIMNRHIQYLIFFIDFVTSICCFLAKKVFAIVGFSFHLIIFGDSNFVTNLDLDVFFWQILHFYHSKCSLNWFLNEKMKLSITLFRHIANNYFRINQKTNNTTFAVPILIPYWKNNFRLDSWNIRPSLPKANNLPTG